MNLNTESLQGGLSGKKNALFAFLLCRRTFSMYEYCYKVHQIGSVDFFEGLMSDFNAYLVSDSNIDWESHRESLADVFPDLDVHIPIASYAFDSCVVLDSTLKYFMTKEPEYFEEIIEGLHATLDMYIQEIEDMDPNMENIDAIVRGHALFVEEANFQNSIISMISAIEVINQEVMDRLSQIVVDRPFLDLTKVDDNEPV